MIHVTKLIIVNEHWMVLLAVGNEERTKAVSTSIRLKGVLEQLYMGTFYHSNTPTYDEQYSKECSLIKGKCYCDGSSLSGEKFVKPLWESTDDLLEKIALVINFLTDCYNDYFELEKTHE